MNKNNNLESQLKEKLQAGKSITLSKEEKERMKAFLLSYREFNPVREKQPETRVRIGVSILMRFVVPSFIFALFFVGGGAVMAEKSLPGDSLYSLKTAFENVREQLTLSSESKARWNTVRVERRLSEARSLASAGRLSKEVAAGLAESVDSYSASIEGGLERLRAQNKNMAALEIDGEYRSTAWVYKNLLRQLESENGELIALLENITEGHNQIALVPKDETLAISRSERGRVFALSEDNDEDVLEISMGDGPASGSSDQIKPMSLTLSLEEDSAHEHEDDASRGGGETGSVGGEGELNIASLRQATEEVSDPVVDALDVSSLTSEQIFNLPIETLESFVSVRLGKAEATLRSAKLDKDLEEELKQRMKDIREIYESAKESHESESEEEIRSEYRRAFKLAEDVRVTVRASKTVPQSDILKYLLDSSKEKNENLEEVEPPIDLNSRVESKIDSSLNKIESSVNNVNRGVGGVLKRLGR